MGQQFICEFIQFRQLNSTKLQTMIETVLGIIGVLALAGLLIILFLPFLMIIWLFINASIEGELNRTATRLFKRLTRWI
jgi:hypothetical protein